MTTYAEVSLHALSESLTDIAHKIDRYADWLDHHGFPDQGTAFRAARDSVGIANKTIAPLLSAPLLISAPN